MLLNSIVRLPKCRTVINFFGPCWSMVAQMILLYKVLCNCKIERSSLLQSYYKENMLETRSLSASNTYRCPSWDPSSLNQAQSGTEALKHNHTHPASCFDAQLWIRYFHLPLKNFSPFPLHLLTEMLQPMCMEKAPVTYAGHQTTWRQPTCCHRLSQKLFHRART